MALDRSTDRSDPLRPQPIRRLARAEEHRRARSSLLGSGTLACPICDAPVALGATSVAPADTMSCPFCGHAGAVRDFLSLSAPSRPARVDVRVVLLSRAVDTQHR
ncbi:MAG: hypothetical protein M3401_00965 [Actinomycetota bacterium]|nr:hypothetical protein [Actinomycetota bacterium]